MTQGQVVRRCAHEVAMLRQQALLTLRDRISKKESMRAKEVELFCAMEARLLAQEARLEIVFQAQVDSMIDLEQHNLMVDYLRWQLKIANNYAQSIRAEEGDAKKRGSRGSKGEAGLAQKDLLSELASELGKARKDLKEQGGAKARRYSMAGHEMRPSSWSDASPPPSPSQKGLEMEFRLRSLAVEHDETKRRFQEDLAKAREELDNSNTERAVLQKQLAAMQDEHRHAEAGGFFSKAKHSSTPDNSTLLTELAEELGSARKELRQMKTASTKQLRHTLTGTSLNFDAWNGAVGALNSPATRRPRPSILNPGAAKTPLNGRGGSF